MEGGGGEGDDGVREVELRRLRLPLARPFTTAHGTVAERDVLLVRVDEGWAECVAPTAPTYTAEYTDGAHHVLRTILVPMLFAGRDLAEVKGHQMAKAALEMAQLDNSLRRHGETLAEHLGATRDAVPAGIALGIPDSVEALVEQAEAALADGYQRIKLKIQPGWDVHPVAALRHHFDHPIELHVDGNGSYRAIDELEHLDHFGLTMIEQPFPADDLRTHAAWTQAMETPVCLDESITSAAAADSALALGACTIVNVKPGRVGGLAEAVRIHDLCVERGAPAWVGGMSETGLGRAANIALAALPGFTMTGDLSASSRWYPVDITPSFELEDGMLRVPKQVELLMDVVEQHTTSTEVLRGDG